MKHIFVYSVILSTQKPFYSKGLHFIQIHTKTAKTTRFALLVVFDNHDSKTIAEVYYVINLISIISQLTNTRNALV